MNVLTTPNSPNTPVTARTPQWSVQRCARCSLANAPVGTFQAAFMFCGYATTTHDEGLLGLVNAASPFGSVTSLVSTRAICQLLVMSRLFLTDCLYM